MAVLVLATAFVTGCTHARSSSLHATPPGLGRLPYSDADVEFMSGMIPHHAQAVVMAGWAPSHGARKDVAIFCERIVVGFDRGEIVEVGGFHSWSSSIVSTARSAARPREAFDLTVPSEQPITSATSASDRSAR